MSAGDADKDHLPAVLGGDLPKEQRDAYEEGHDGDTPSTNGIANSEQDSLKKEAAVNSEKTNYHDVSSSSSEDGAPKDRDVEKGDLPEPEEAKEPVDPNIVDWDGPEDKDNPYNW